MTPTWRADAETYARDAAFVPRLADALVDELAPRPGECILDLGCGDGALTHRLVVAGAEVVAVDADASMVAAARQRGLPDVRQLDGQRLRDGGLDDAAPFDAVFSNAALHWMGDAAGVVEGVHGALRPGGRFVAEFGGFGNIATVRVAAGVALAAEGGEVPAWFFPSADVYAELLVEHGFVDVEAVLVPRPTFVSAGMEAWLRTFMAAPLAALAPDREEAVVARIVRLLAPVLRDEAGRWWLDYVRLRVRATRP